MENEIFARIDFKNCGTPYDYTICKWHDVSTQIDIAEFAITEADEQECKEQMTQIIITPCFMTSAEFEQWFIDNVESEA